MDARAFDGIRALSVLAGLGIGLLLSAAARGHCDTMDGPVVTAAKEALAKADVTPVLKWVHSDYEAEVSEAFRRVLTVRTKGHEARELADRYFFETVVRLHRLGEGQAFTGLKPAGTDPGPAVRAADEALEEGSVDPLVKMITDKVAATIRARFAHATQTRQHADETVAAGREFVEAYVAFVHYAEHLYTIAQGHTAAHEKPAKTAEVHEGHGSD